MPVATGKHPSLDVSLGGVAEEQYGQTRKSPYLCWNDSVVSQMVEEVVCRNFIVRNANLEAK